MNGTSQGTRYSGVSSLGASFTVSPACSPSATSSVDVADIGYAATASPVTIYPGGATPDGNGGYDILVGQRFTPMLVVSGTPAGTTVSGYQWSVSDSSATFQSWTVSADQSHTTEVDGPGTVTTNPAGGWYWNEMSNTTATVTCNATVTPPSGQGSPFSVTATQKISVMVPTASWGVDPTTVPSISNGVVTNEDTYVGFQDLSTSAGQYGAQTVWYPVNISVPSPFSGGQGCFAQVVTPSSTLTRTVMTTTPPPNPPPATTYTFKIQNAQGQWVLPGSGLDGAFPYAFGWTTDASGNITNLGTGSGTSTFTAGSVGASGDFPRAQESTPDVDSGGADWQTGSMSYTFNTWLMYRPSGGTWVPLKEATSWKVDANAQGGPSNWSAAVTGPGYVKPSPANTNVFPSWTTLIPSSTALKAYRP